MLDNGIISDVWNEYFFSNDFSIWKKKFVWNNNIALWCRRGIEYKIFILYFKIVFMIIYNLIKVSKLYGGYVDLEGFFSNYEVGNK